MKTLDPEEFNNILGDRADTYGFLSRLYSVEIDKELLDKMKELDFNIEADIGKTSQGYQLWQTYLKQTGINTLTDLAVDFVRIFIGHGKRKKDIAYPYESVYTSPKRMLMQEARDEVLSFYLEEDLYTIKEFVEPEDHIAVELEFMAHLCRKIQKLSRTGDTDGILKYLEKQKLFLTQHLLHWAPTFCEDVISIACEDLYKGLAIITNDFLTLDGEVVDDLIDEFSSIGAQA